MQKDIIYTYKVLALSVLELQFGQGMGMGWSMMTTWMGFYSWMPWKLTISVVEEYCVDMDCKPLDKVVI